MFAIDALIGDCQAALKEAQPALAVRDIMSRVMSRPNEVADAFDPPTRAELVPIYASPELTILRIIWAPAMAIPPHDHLMWAVIGIYGGGEHNRFYRRSPDGLIASGERTLSERDTAVLGDDTIHAVTNPSSRGFTGSLHVYGGDYINKPRSLWNPDTMAEEPATGERMRSLFDSANQGLPPSGPQGTVATA
jgi:predicted metal-dependent enzyme (double-stranded beta helix superfamily)